MAGGKETPRQKMIGMMYLVLTALLALNVSKSILDAFINIEANVAAGNITEVQRGDEKKSDVAAKQNGQDGPNKTAISVFKVMEKIDGAAAEKIQLIDRVKLLIFQAIGEDLSPSAQDPIIIKDRANFKFDYNNVSKGLSANSEPTKPIELNLNNVQKKGDFDAQMLIMGINESITTPNTKAPGFAVWPAMQEYRKTLCDLILQASSDIDEDGKSYSFNDPKIKKFKNLKDLNLQLEKALDASKVKEDDRVIIKNVYKGLTKNEMQPDPHEGYNEDGTPKKLRHWVGGTFDHAPAVAAIAALSGLQSEILTARADAIAYLASKVGGGNYAFNKVTSLAIAAPAVTGGSTDTLRVMMAAFDSEKQPIVVPDEGKGTLVETKGGQAYIAYTAPSSGEIDLSGTIAIKDKFGNATPVPYSTTVQVVTKAGSVSLPEMNILYAGWPHKLLATTAGTVSTSVAAAGATIRPTTINGQKGYTIKANTPGRRINVRLSGKDANGNSINFGSYPYDVKPFPKAKLVNNKCSRTGNTRLRVTLGADCPLNGVNFTVTGGTVYIGSDKTTFNGALLKRDLLRRAMPGRSYAVLINYKRNGTNKTESISATIDVTR